MRKNVDISNRILVEPEDWNSMPDLCFDPSPFIAGGIAAAGTIGGAAINAGARWGSRTYMRVAKEMANYNQQMNEAMYNKYQSPAALMRQFSEAGLNPNLIYGAASSHVGSVAAGQVSTNPNDYAGDRTRYGDALKEITSGAVAAYQDVMQRNSNINNTDAVTEATKVKAAYDAAKTEGQVIQNQYQDEMMSHQLEGLITQNSINAIKLENDKIFAEQERKQGLLRTQAEIEASHMDAKKKEKEISKIDWDMKSVEQSIAESKARIWNMQEGIRLGYGNLAVAKMNAQSNRMNAETNSSNAETNQYNAWTNRYGTTENINFQREKFQKEFSHRATMDYIEAGRKQQEFDWHKQMQFQSSMPQLSPFPFLKTK